MFRIKMSKKYNTRKIFKTEDDRDPTCGIAFCFAIILGVIIKVIEAF